MRQTRSSRRTAEEVAQLPAEEQEQRGRDIIVAQLSMMDRSRHQLDEAMERRGILSEIRASLLDHFEEIGLVDDAHFAEVLVRTRFADKRASRRAIADELRRKGVAPDIAERALLEIDDDAEYEAAVEEARRRLAKGSGNPATLNRRVYGALARKGYSPSVCSRALRDAGALADGDV